MKYLLDVNALVALGVFHHQFHDRVDHWIRAQPDSTKIITCSIVELGFVRILCQVPAYGFNVREACGLLTKTKEFWSVVLHSDQRELIHLPKWVKLPKQLTDGHLLDLAHAHAAQLATFDKGIPGALLIP